VVGRIHHFYAHIRNLAKRVLTRESKHQADEVANGLRLHRHLEVVILVELALFDREGKLGLPKVGILAVHHREAALRWQ